jgi:hypothetical protein
MEEQAKYEAGEPEDDVQRLVGRTIVKAKELIGGLSLTLDDGTEVDAFEPIKIKWGSQPASNSPTNACKVG